MTSNYNPKTDIPALDGKVFFITGGTAGLGEGSITNLAAHNPGHIFFTGRNSQKASELISRIKQTHPEVQLTYIPCDMTKLSSVQAAATKFLESSQRLDLLMCNAGIMAWDAATTPDGYEIQFQVNQLSHSLLIKLLLPILLRTARGEIPSTTTPTTPTTTASTKISPPANDVRIVMLSSQAYLQAPAGGIDFATLKSSQATLGSALKGRKWARYGQSKLANMLYADALAKRYPELTSVAVHPGFIRTDLVNSMGWFDRFVVSIVGAGKFLEVEEGPYNQLWAATMEGGKVKSGEYYEPVGVVGKRKTGYSNDEALADRLWEWTEGALEEWK